MFCLVMSSIDLSQQAVNIPMRMKRKISKLILPQFFTTVKENGNNEIQSENKN